ncbi:MAG: hypothetical protein UW86_C0001G0018 [Microgenomates group bacterium GW2011_GWA1_Microgenomates_45_10]|nr:MAG: hypothetical protein UW69_C0003G0026 [Microgenomates group bacterium GW2011_GWA2_44_7]KKT77274.1 MAG: hypothetical protein UW73_C0024G0012 [Microgenomates group bacterium GW2011_GWB1_44_8]KKT87465.1 MAG: hypothetical protein UW86_C0001G0018 [Microgenomates group bacterium GW2011_GWA1_Microgenomates_45_10]
MGGFSREHEKRELGVHTGPAEVDDPYAGLCSAFLRLTAIGVRAYGGGGGDEDDGDDVEFDGYGNPKAKPQEWKEATRRLLETLARQRQEEDKKKRDSK